MPTSGLEFTGELEGGLGGGEGDISLTRLTADWIGLLLVCAVPEFAVVKTVDEREVAELEDANAPGFIARLPPGTVIFSDRSNCADAAADAMANGDVKFALFREACSETENEENSRNEIVDP